MLKKCILSVYIVFFCLTINSLSAQNLKAFEISEDWVSKIEETAPSEATVSVKKKKKVLLFSLFTGFDHWVVPHTSAVVKILGEKSGVFEVTETMEIQSFDEKNLSKYDLVVLNNNCSKSDNRNIFYDVFVEAGLSETESAQKAAKMEANLLNYVSGGGGLVLLHGGIVMQNKSQSFGEMVGGSFDYHPKQQSIDVELVDPEHPLVAAFDGEGFSHVDEPYIFNNAYLDYNFRPLLSMETAKIEGLREGAVDKVKYISWIKSYGKGRVFYSSPSHNAQSYDNPKLLKFLLDGMQYAAGDLKCDDSPIGK